MEPSEFFYLILPLGAFTIILVSLVLYVVRKEESMHTTELETLSALFMLGVLNKENFGPTLQHLLKDKVINQDEYERLDKLLELTFKRRVETRPENH